MYGKFKRYPLTDKQIRGVANIILHEQGTLAGRYAEASLIANRAELTGKSIESTCTGGWFAYGRFRYNQGTDNSTCRKVVEDVICKGFRTLPLYVNEHDCLPDIKKAMNGDENVRNNRSKWEKLVTKITNVYTSKWWFYCFPSVGDDPFGTTYGADQRDKLGHFCYTVGQAKENEARYTGKLVTQYPNRGWFQKGDHFDGVGLIQSFLNWYYNDVLTVDKKYGKITAEYVSKFQKDHGLHVNGKWGHLCTEKAMTYTNYR